MIWPNALTPTNAIIQEPDTSKVRQAADWFEVRTDGSGELIGWIRGINGAAVEDDTIEFLAGAEEPDDMGFVVETNGSVVEVSENSSLRFRVRKQQRSYPNEILHERPYEDETPVYAQRRGNGPRKETDYIWRAIEVSAAEAQLLFDYDDFVPHTPKADPLAVAGLVEEELFHGSLPRAPILDPDRYPGRAGSGFQR